MAPRRPRAALLALLWCAACVCMSEALQIKHGKEYPNALTAAHPDGFLAACECDDHGYCRPSTGECACKGGFTGTRCSIRTCPNACSGHGSCEAGICMCEPGWAGYDCSFRSCSPDPMCSNHGVCSPRTGACVCFPGFSGPACGDSERSGVGCPGECSGRGICRGGSCYCESGWSGVDCGRRICPNMCSGHGSCNATTHECDCAAPWYGDSCNLRNCVYNCGRHGHCDHKRASCVCDPGYWGVACQKRHCLNDCNTHGRCVSTDGSETGTHICACDAGWAGADCSHRDCGPFFTADVETQECAIRRCFDDCNGPDHGFCDYADNYTCACVSGWVGPSCNLRPCPYGCSGHGVCRNGTCECNSYWTGPTCSEPRCPLRCNSGECVIEILPEPPSQSSKPEFLNTESGKNGSVSLGPAPPPPPKLKHGEWMDPESAGGLTQIDLQSLERSKEGSLEPLHGVYVDSIKDTKTGVIAVVKRFCACQPGFGGAACDRAFCPNDCSGHGVCHRGSCFCDSGYTGDDCATIRRSHDRANASALKTACATGCVHGKCVLSSYTNTGDGELVASATCLCNRHFTGEQCDIPAEPVCPGNCSNGHGRCTLQGCVCNAGYFGEHCGIHAPGQCRHDCHHRGRCDAGVCVCNRPFAGLTCGMKGCLNQCSGNGMCDTSTWTCLCYPSFRGSDCSQHADGSLAEATPKIQD